MSLDPAELKAEADRAALAAAKRATKRERMRQTYQAAFDDVQAIDGEAAEKLAEHIDQLDDHEGGHGEPPEEPPSSGGDGGDGDKPERKNLYRGLMIPRINNDNEYFYSPNIVPDDCPVKPLGVDQDHAWFLNRLGMLVPLKAAGCGQSNLEHLFGNSDYLIRAWPQCENVGNKNLYIPKAKGFHAQYARMALFDACHKRGLFDPRDRVRGRGFWADQDGNLIVHMGDVVLTHRLDGRQFSHGPGEYDGLVYEARPAVPRPTPGAPEQVANLLSYLDGWNWERGPLDARLALGMMGAMVMSGALDWRPMAFILGDAASGKSTLQKLMRNLLPGRVIGTADASEAALRGMMGRDAMAVSFDEIEADSEDGGRASKVMKLARYAASGDKVYRATKDQDVNEFVLLGCMLFSAINVPKMRPQDKQRFCFLKMNAIKTGAAKPFKEMGQREARELGQAMVGRLVAGWPRWAETLETYTDFLKAARHTTRGAQNFGTLLAAADLLLFDELDGERAMCLANDYQRDQLMEYEDQEQNFAKWWRRLLAAQPEAWRRDGLPSVGEIVGRWLKAARDPIDTQDNKDEAAAAARKLLRVGLTVIKDRKAGEYWLAVPNDHPATQALFEGTDLAEGGWQLALRQGPRWDLEMNPEGLWRTQQVVMAGGRANATLIRLSAKHDFGDGSPKPLFAEPQEGEG